MYLEATFMPFITRIYDDAIDLRSPWRQRADELAAVLFGKLPRRRPSRAKSAGTDGT